MSLGSENGIPAVMNVTPTGGYNNANCGNGWGGDGAIWLIILFLIWGNGGWGNGFGGFGGGFGGGYPTEAILQRSLDTQSIIGKLDGINSGVCSLGYDQLSQMNNISAQIASGFSGVGNAICNSEYQNAQLINGVNNTVMQGFNAANVVALQNQNALQTQLADCCCKNQTGQMQLGNAMERGFCDVNYGAATNTNAIIQNAHNDTDRVIARLDAMESARKDETIADLRSKLAACGDQTTAQYIINQLTGVISPRAVPAYPAASPCGLGNWAPQVLTQGWGYNNGCGCNNGCNSGCCGCNG